MGFLWAVADGDCQAEVMAKKVLELALAGDDRGGNPCTSAAQPGDILVRLRPLPAVNP